MANDKLAGSRLRDLRKSKGLTQQELADLLLEKYEINDVGNGAISMYETGQRKIPTEINDALHDFFGVSIDWMRGHSEIKNPTALLISVEPDALDFAQKLSELPNGLRRTMLQSAGELLDGYMIVWRKNMEQFARLRDTLEAKGMLSAWEKEHGVNLPD